MKFSFSKRKPANCCTLILFGRVEKYHLYLGKAGHLTVMSEFLMRGWNVAIPEVDIGDDIFKDFSKFP